MIVRSENRRHVGGVVLKWNKEPNELDQRTGLIIWSWYTTHLDDTCHSHADPGDARWPLVLDTGHHIVQHGVGHVVADEVAVAVGLQTQATVLVRQGVSAKGVRGPHPLVTLHLGAETDVNPEVGDLQTLFNKMT